MVELGGTELWLDRAVVAGTAVLGGTDSDRREEVSPSSGGDEETEGVDSAVVVVVVVAGPWPFLPNFARAPTAAKAAGLYLIVRDK